MDTNRYSTLPLSLSITSRATRSCAVCGKREFESNLGKNEFWLCDRCLSKLKRLLSDDLSDDCK